jgi:hypothetical protein
LDPLSGAHPEKRKTALKFGATAADRSLPTAGNFRENRDPAAVEVAAQWQSPDALFAS